MENIAIYGSGGFGREVLTIIKAINTEKKIFNVIGFFDDYAPKGKLVNGVKVLGGIKDLNEWNEELNIVLTIGDSLSRKKVFYQINNPNIKYPSLIHPSAILGDPNFIKIGKGVIICAGCLITTNIEIKDFVILNLACTVGHDSIISSFASFMPSVNISGEVNIGEAVYVGTGAKLINRLSVGENTKIGAGATVINDIPANCTAVGVPAKVVSK